ncbi:hypothetical protein QSV08_11595 [Maribacter sp. BPC-D8]|uniref:hypothetical protein n=1 Tax=Maribacter sp. BPC-D8 TaxID=3053613 RepID=UPI002B485B44|nr:hypothetical protein [Maribacter sp. BPC-D8]WRI27867.1 hypothetical protein QSV08_11595 [Maribacter sp. BPC-D8]
MLKILNIETIKKELLSANSTTVNFPKKTTFEFPDNYKNVVTKIKTKELSAECILFDAVKSVNETKEFSDVDYWSENMAAEKIKDYWFFGTNGQGDSWVLHSSDKVLFYDHNKGELGIDNLVDLELNFDQWLQFAFLNKQLEDAYHNDSLTLALKNDYKSKLSELSTGLLENYPFEI